MEYEWDEVKHRHNLAKHGVDFEIIAQFDWSSAIIAMDIQRDYDEARYLALGFLGSRLYVCIYTQRGSKRRLISLRKANSREKRLYEKTIFDHEER